MEFLADSSKETRSRVLALYTPITAGNFLQASSQVIDHLRPFAEDATLAPFVMRALGDMGLDLLAPQAGPALRRLIYWQPVLIVPIRGRRLQRPLLQLPGRD